jgi:hypothetical protein
MADEGWTAGPKGFVAVSGWRGGPTYMYGGLSGQGWGVRVAAGFKDSQNPNQAIGFVRAFGGVIWIGMGDEGHESKQTTVGGGALFTHAFTQEGKTDETRQKQRDDRMRGTPFRCI